MTPDKFIFENQKLGIRIINADKTSYNGFMNPVEVGAVIRPENG